MTEAERQLISPQWGHAESRLAPPSPTYPYPMPRNRSFPGWAAQVPRAMQSHVDVSATSKEVLRNQSGIESSNRALYQLKRDEGMVNLRMRLLI